VTRSPANMLGWDEAHDVVGCKCDEAYPRLCSGPVRGSEPMPEDALCPCECHQCDESRWKADL
jgi:hypothetical protein